MLDRIRALVSQLKQWDHDYYVKDKPTVADAVYDSIFKELQALEKEYPQHIDPTSPTQRVSGGISEGFKVVKHTYPMLSIKTETNPSREALKHWLESIQDVISDTYLIMEYKYDGLGLSLKYVDGTLVQALTRGDGEKGENVIANAVYIHGIPSNIPQKEGIVTVRGEVLMYKKDFENINTRQREAGLKEYVNPRNAAAGTLRSLDSAVVASRHLRFIPYSAKWVNNDVDCFEEQFYDQVDVLKVLVDWGFVAPHFEYCSDTAMAIDIDTIVDVNYNAFESVSKIRNQLPFEIDGVVFKVSNLADQKELGFRSREPVWAIAYKFEAEQATTKLLGIDVQVGRTGKLTPVARLDPVFVGGTTITNVTLHNIFDLRGRGVRVGDTVIVQRAGDVIPEIVGPIKDLRLGYLPNYHITQCPDCLSKAVRAKGEREYKCINNSCKAQVKRSIEHYVSRLAMNIDGLGPATIDVLHSNGVLNNLTDIYHLSFSKLKPCGYSDKVAVNLLEAIESSKHTTFAKFVYALGISDVGEGTSTRLAKVYSDVVQLSMATAAELMSIPDIGETTAASIRDYFSSIDNTTMAFYLHRNCLRFKTVEPAGTQLAGKVFVITGSFDNFGREELKQRITELGGKVSGSVGKSTNYLIVGNEPGAGKVGDADELDVPTITLMGNHDIESALEQLKMLG